MIGYYVHHQGAGHGHRALALARHLGAAVTGLSSAPPPKDWPGEWIELERDDAEPVVDPGAHGHLHWAPLRHAGHTARMARIAQWIDAVRPRAVVVDVSVEVALLCRLLGVPVVTVLQPGERRDRVHQLGFGVADRLVAPWPASASGMLHGVDPDDPRLVHVGALSRFDDRVPSRPPASQQVLVMLGRGGHGLERTDLADAVAATPGWSWRVAGPGEWVDDPWELLRSSDVVVTHAGQNALAEIAAARRPAIVVPQPRPHGEQLAIAEVLRDQLEWPVLVRDRFGSPDWPASLAVAGTLDGDGWRSWNDGLGGARFAKVVDEVAAA